MIVVRSSTVQKLAGSRLQGKQPSDPERYSAPHGGQSCSLGACGGVHSHTCRALIHRARRERIVGLSGEERGAADRAGPRRAWEARIHQSGSRVRAYESQRFSKLPPRDPTPLRDFIETPFPAGRTCRAASRAWMRCATTATRSWTPLMLRGSVISTRRGRTGSRSRSCPSGCGQGACSLLRWPWGASGDTHTPPTGGLTRVSGWRSHQSDGVSVSCRPSQMMPCCVCRWGAARGEGAFAAETGGAICRVGCAVGRLHGRVPGERQYC